MRNFQPFFENLLSGRVELTLEGFPSRIFCTVKEYTSDCSRAPERPPRFQIKRLRRQDQ